MSLIITPRKALNKAYLKSKPLRSNIESFKENLIKLLEQINHAESEEFNKNVLSDFLKNTYYKDNYSINTKGRNDLVIHNGKTAQETVGVIIEAKRASNAEMLKQGNINTKAMQELVLYYLRERITNKNLEVKHLIATSVNEWFIFDANVFEKHFAQNKKLIKQFEDFEAKVLSGIKTDFFYKEIAERAIDEVKDNIEFTYINISDFEVALKNSDKGDDAKLIPLYKILSPQHLLKASFVNDSNSLNKSFYTELLHIIGLVETKKGSKKLIARKKLGNRNNGALIESAIIQLDSENLLTELPNRKQYGEKKEEQLFNVAIELAITWINRILFLKLLEAQLVTYHKNDASYKFLNIETIKDFDELNTLFFQVLAIKTNDRNSDVKEKFAKIPYLNSSLFERSEIEGHTLRISNLSDSRKIPILSSTVLKNKQGRKLTGELNAVEYIFAFLDAYDFASDGGEEIQEDNKSLINASVLGLIFEKINGYKDGSFFTPGFITMYMSKEAIRKSVIQKFNDVKKWACTSFEDLYNAIEDSAEANAIINSIKICDPAVGSGHFLVSALNELIAVKAELKLLQDKAGKRLKEYNVEVVNDELIISDEDGQIVDYNPKNSESQRVQETLFNEKQTIIENCLFGVDINPNSVKICRLRLWIELLKNAYYKEDGELETLPNIDINIKCGNSLISRFDLDIDLKDALKKSKLNISQYKSAVQSYRTARSKEEKWEMEKLINEVKTGFRTEIFYHDPKAKKLENLRVELKMLELPQTLLGESASEKRDRNKKREKQKVKFDKLNAEIEEIKSNKIYENAFEWRFEFPEVLSDIGEFVGFDLIIGNPPYGVAIKDKKERSKLTASLGKVPDYEIYYMFINRSKQLLNKNYYLSLIVPNTVLFNVYAKDYRLALLANYDMQEILDCTNFKVFDDATVNNIIISFKNCAGNQVGYKSTNGIDNFYDLINQENSYLETSEFLSNNNNWALLFKLSENVNVAVKNIKENCVALSTYFPELSQGLIAYDAVRGQTEDFIKKRTLHSETKVNDSYKQWLNGEDVTRYKVKWNGKDFFSYDERVANPRQPKFFTGERIVIREITNPRIFAAYTSDELYFDPAIIVILKSANFSLLTLLAILNSKLGTFYHFNTSPKATKGAFPKLLITDVNNFPLPINPNPYIASQIDLLVSNVIANYDETLSEKIDALVYKFYELNDIDIALINNAI